METGLSCVGRIWSLLSFVAACATSIGFFMPYWLEGVIHHAEGDLETHLGVFRRCNYLMSASDMTTRRPVTVVVKECGRYATFWEIPSIWWQVSTVTTGVGCGLGILIAFSALLCCCVQDSMSKNLSHIAGLVQLFSVLLVAAGCISFAAGWSNKEVQEACGQGANSFNFGSCKLSWAFYTTVSGGACLFFCSILAFFAAKRKGGYQRVAPKDKKCRTEM